MTNAAVLNAAVLNAVRHPGAVRAADALAWFAGGPRSSATGTETVIGYLLAPDRAEWFRCVVDEPGRTEAHGPDGGCDLDGAFELFATDGARQLRWLHDADGAGTAVSLAEDAADLPDGEEIAVATQRRRLVDTGTGTGTAGGTGATGTPATAARLLAGRVVAASNGWATLVTARYSPCEVPVAAAAGDEVWARLAEYAVRDGHGNLTVVDTLLLGLEARPATPPPGKERTA
jgi:hypothetical protein